LFRGESTVSVDAKGRLTIPARYRETLHDYCNSTIVVAKDKEDPCLVLYAIQDWEDFEAKLMSLPNAIPEVREMQRYMVGGAAESEIDKQGRIPLTAEHRDFIGLSKNVVLVGQHKKFEIWSEETWKPRMQQNFENKTLAKAADIPGLDTLIW
jgi:MraZ protein